MEIPEVIFTHQSIRHFPPVPIEKVLRNTIKKAGVCLTLVENKKLWP